MGITSDKARDFFDRPFYLKQGRFLIDIRSMLVRELVGTARYARILDLGCGDGSISLQLLNETTQLTLVDISKRMLEIATERIPEDFRKNIRVIDAPINEFMPASPYDLVICIGVLAHVPNIEDAVAKIAECVRPGGLAIIEFTPNPNPLGKLLFPYYWIRGTLAGSPMGYATNKIPFVQLLQICKQSGFRLVQLKRHFFPMPTMAFWSQRWLYGYAMFAARNRFMSRIGTEHIAVLSKVE